MLKSWTPDLFTVDHELRLGLGIPFPARMTVVRLPDRSLALVSAVAIDDALAADLARLGPVSHVVAPSRMHDRHLAAAHARYPEARLLAADGLAEKHPALPLEPLVPSRYPALRDALEGILIEGAPRLSETELFHRPSGTLVVTDLVFNVETPAFATGLLLRTTGTHGRLAQSRVWSFVVEDRARARASCDRLAELPIERVIVAHGAVLDGETAKARLLAALTRTRPLARPPARPVAFPARNG